MKAKRKKRVRKNASMVVTPNFEGHIIALVITLLARLYETPRKKAMKAIGAYFE